MIFAAIIAAISSLINTLILFRARATQEEVKREVKKVTRDTDARAMQIEELRSLSVQRMNHIYTLERLADRLESALTDTAELEKRVKSAFKKALEERASEVPRDRATD